MHSPRPSLNIQQLVQTKRVHGNLGHHRRTVSQLNQGSKFPHFTTLVTSLESQRCAKTNAVLTQYFIPQCSVNSGGRWCSFIEICLSSFKFLINSGANTDISFPVQLLKIFHLLLNFKIQWETNHFQQLNGKANIFNKPDFQLEILNSHFLEGVETRWVKFVQF